ncbi:MAG: DUF5687 family protein [Bacteroidota bacterium]|nr:DUF5687 family protein [Bacteroidota bacterium]
MFKWFINHLWKEATRATNFSKNLALNIVIGFFIFLSLLYVLLIGFVLGKILEESFPDINPVWIFNSAIFYYIAVDMLFRFLIQNLPRLNIDSYLHLPIKKSTIVHFVVSKTMTNVLNYIPLLIIIPFTFRVTAAYYDPMQTLSWILALVFIIFGNNFFGTYIKRLLASKPGIVAGFGLFIVTFMLLDYFDLISLSRASAEFFGLSLSNSWFLFIALTYMTAAYALHYHYLRRRLYAEEIDTRKSKRIDAISKIKYFKSLGYFGTLLAIDMKLIWRHKRTRTIIYMLPIFLLYGFFFYPQEMYIEFSGMLIFVGVFMTGGLMINYANYAMAYESNYFDALLANNFDFRQYFRMKFIIAIMICTFCYVLTIPYVFFGPKILLINTVTFLYNIGTLSFILLFVATYNKKRMDLSKGATFNYQGMGASNWFAMIPAFLLPVFIYLPFSLAGLSYTGLIFIGVLGLIGLVFYKTFLNLIFKQFMKRRYIMADGFREK